MDKKGLFVVMMIFSILISRIAQYGQYAVRIFVVLLIISCYWVNFYASIFGMMQGYKVLECVEMCILCYLTC